MYIVRLSSCRISIHVLLDNKWLHDSGFLAFLALAARYYTASFRELQRMESVSRSHLRAREDSGKLWVNKIVGPFMSIRRAKSWWIQLMCLSGPSMIVLQLPILQSGRVQRTPGVHSMCTSRKFWLGWFTFGPLVCRSEAWTRSVRLPNGKLGQLNHTWLVVWNMNFMTFHILGISSSQLTFMFFHILGFHHPNWRTHIFQRGWNHQSV